MNSQRKFALLRIAFGLVWAADAYFKWDPLFLNNFLGVLGTPTADEPALVQAWIGFWVHVSSFAPYPFAVLVALGETAIAFGLIFGLLTRVALGGGAVLSFIIWSVPEKFGLPYGPGSTDIGPAVAYMLLCLTLLAAHSWRAYSIDSWLYKKWPLSLWQP